MAAVHGWITRNFAGPGGAVVLAATALTALPGVGSTQQGASGAVVGTPPAVSPTASSAASPAAPRTAPPLASAAVPLVFDGVTVIDVAHGKLQRAQRVVVVGARIQQVGRAAGPLPPGAQVVNARGRYLIPGLWDMHAHVNGGGRTLYPRYLAYGVTGLREMAQRFPHGADSFRVWQREIDAGTQIGPRGVGPSADLTNGEIEIQTPEDAARIMDSLRAAGDVFVKYHGDSSRELFFAMAREARRVGLPMVGHTQGGNAILGGFTHPFTDVEAADSGLKSIEHMEENWQCWGLWADLRDSAKAAVTAASPVMAKPCVLVAQAYRRNGTWVTPTLSIQESRGTREPRHTRLWARHRAFVQVLRRAGFRRFLAGTDAYPGADYRGGELTLAQPGLSLLWELELLVNAGLPPLEALQAATLSPAEFFGATDSLGTVAAGKLADLVLLDANPLTDIHNITTLRAVVANGRYYDRALLDALDPTGRPLLPQVATYGHPAAGAATPAP